jgi:hypothetical protein
VVVTIDARSKLILKEVRHVPDMHPNLISIEKLDDVGLVSHFGAGKWKLAKRSMVIAKGSKEGSSYSMYKIIFDGEANVLKDSKDLWHK